MSNRTKVRVKSDVSEELLKNRLIKEITFVENNLDTIDIKIVMEFSILKNRNWVIYRVGGVQLFPVNRNNGSYTIPVTIRNINFEFTPNFESYSESNFAVNSFLTNHIVISNEQKNFRRILQDESNIEEEIIIIILNNTGNIFEESLSGSLILISNPILLTHFKAYYKLSHILFWCLLHELPFSHWFHELHLNFIIGIFINTTSLLQEINPVIYSIVQKIQVEKNINDILEFKEWTISQKFKPKELATFIINYEVTTIREPELI
ncbi:2823_t:CDS:2 [Diversispora eburnea]|uniref:2823_t:CDS:1 n=1 Tax=Diversispora eburnea TaxID=1213867 RepID=A0A9N9CUA2_9GLOM|nr:2823_t:CDS:2 [Diversispora eburnea]